MSENTVDLCFGFFAGTVIILCTFALIATVVATVVAAVIDIFELDDWWAEQKKRVKRYLLVNNGRDVPGILPEEMPPKTIVDVDDGWSADDEPHIIQEFHDGTIVTAQHFSKWEGKE